MKFSTSFPGIFLMASILGCNGVKAPLNNKEENPDVPIEVAQKPLPAGHAIFEQKCAACHGSDGTAGIGNAANLQISKLDSNTIFKVVTEGRGGMPPFKTQLTDSERGMVSAYVLKIRK